MDVSAFDINDRYNKLTQEQTIYSYLGGLALTDLNQVHTDIEKVLSTNIGSKAIRKKLFHILVEASQNLYNYYKNLGALSEEFDLFILLNKSKGQTTITTGNFLYSSEIPTIQTRIEMVNAMDENQIKQLYRGILDFGRPDEAGSGGAGLGIIDFARKSKQKLIYNFDKIDNRFSFFTLHITILD